MGVTAKNFFKDAMVHKGKMNWPNFRIYFRKRQFYLQVGLGYLTTFTMLKNGSMMAMTMVPTMPQTTKMTAGSSMLERFLTSESISRL